MSNDTHELDDSVKNDEGEDTPVTTEEETKDDESEEESEEENNEDEDDKEPEPDKKDEEEKPKDYRPKSEKPSAMVPVKKFMKVKKAYGDLKKEREEDGEDLSTEDLDSLAEEYNLEPKALKKLAKTISTMTLKEAQKIIAPLKAEKIEAENAKSFEADFEKTILSKYPQLASKKEQFKKIAFSPDLVNQYPTLEAIRKEFFADVTTKEKTKDSPEGGSQVSSKTEQIDFANMTDEQHARVLKDPELKKKYYKYQDEQGF